MKETGALAAIQRQVQWDRLIAVVEERETTAVIRPGWEATVLPDGAIVATRSTS